MAIGPRGISRSTQRAILLAVIIAVATVTWLALVATQNEQGLFGEGAAAWAQAIMSVAAILAAIVIDQGASRRDREERREIAERGRIARVALLRRGKAMLDNVRNAIQQRTPAPGLVFEGLGIDALKAGQAAIRHYIERGSDDDAALVWVLCRAGDILDAAVEDLWRKPIETPAQQSALAARATQYAQDLHEVTDEYEAGLFNV